MMDGGLAAGGGGCVGVGGCWWDWGAAGGGWGGWREDIVDVDRGWILVVLGVRMCERRE